MILEWNYSICKLQYKIQLPKGQALILHHQVLHLQQSFSNAGPSLDDLPFDS